LRLIGIAALRKSGRERGSKPHFTLRCRFDI